jgi:hypothetical protein
VTNTNVQAVASGVQVLVVEPSSLIRRAVRHTLETLGAEVFEAASLEGCDAQRISLVVCKLPDDSFDGLARWHAENAQHAAVLPLILPGELVPEGLPERFAAPLRKPFTPHALGTAVAVLVPDLPELASVPFPEAIDLDELDLEIDIDPIVSASQIPSRRAREAPEPEPVERPRVDVRFSDDDWDVEPAGGPLRPSLTDSIFDELPGQLGPGLPIGESLETFPVLRPEVVGEEDDLDIVEVEAVDPLPEWASILIAVWPVMAREGVREERGRLLATSLAVSGMPAPAHWSRPDVAQAAAERVELLSRTRGLSGDLGACSPLELLATVRRRRLDADLYIETERAQWRLRLAGDQLLSIQPAATHKPRLMAELLVDIGAVDRATLEAFLQTRSSIAGDLGSALETAGIVSHAQIREALDAQALGYLADVCAVHEGYHVMRMRKPGTHDQPGRPLSRMLLTLLRRGAVKATTTVAASDLVATDPVTTHLLGDALDGAEAALLSRCREPARVGDVAVDLDVVLRLVALGALLVLAD